MNIREKLEKIAEKRAKEKPNYRTQDCNYRTQEGIDSYMHGFSLATDLLLPLLGEAIAALDIIEKAYPTSGERMAHQNYALKTLNSINEKLEGMK